MLVWLFGIWRLIGDTVYSSLVPCQWRLIIGWCLNLLIITINSMLCCWYTTPHTPIVAIAKITILWASKQHQTKKVANMIHRVFCFDFGF
jgi:hypothetical protein